MPDLSDEQRMQAAVGLSAGRPDEDAEQIRRWGTQRAIVLRVVVVLSTIVAGLAIGMLLLSGSPPDRTRSEVSGWREGLATVSSIVGFIVIVAAVIWLFSTGQFTSGWRSPLFALTWRQRRSVRKQVMGTRLLSPDELPVARQLANSMTRGWPQLLNSTGILLVWLSNALTSDTRWKWALCGFLAVGLVVVAIQTSRDSLLAHRFLAAHPAPMTEPSGD